jgi:hypothetical protein
MAGIGLSNLDVNPRILEAARKGCSLYPIRSYVRMNAQPISARFSSTVDILQLSAAEIVRRTQLTDKDAMQLIDAASRATYSRKSVTAVDAIRNLPVAVEGYLGSAFLTTGCEVCFYFNSLTR